MKFEEVARQKSRYSCAPDTSNIQKFLSANILKASTYRLMKFNTWYHITWDSMRWHARSLELSCAPDTPNIQKIFEREYSESR